MSKNRSEPVSTSAPVGRKKAIVAVIVLVAGLAYLWTRPPAPVLPRHSEGMDENVAALIEQKVAAVDADRRNGEAHGVLGAVYEANDLLPEARECFEHAARLAPHDPVWPYRRAVVLQAMGELDAAFEGLLEVTRAHPSYAPALHRLGVFHLDAGSFEEAATALQRAAALEPEAAPCQVGLAQVALAKRDYAQAVPLLERAIELEPRYKLAHFLLGTAYRGLGRVEEARPHLARGTEAERRFLLDRTSAMRGQFIAGLASQLQAAAGLIQAGRSEEALILLEEARRQRPEDPDVLNNLAIAYQKTGQAQRALGLFHTLLKKDSENFVTYVNLADCLIDVGDYEEAWLKAQKAATLAPRVPQAQYALGRSLLKLGRFQEAYDRLHFTLSLSTSNPATFLALAECCLRLGRLEEARENYLEVAKRSPNHLGTQLSLCLVYSRLGNSAEARKHLSRARQLDPENPRVQQLQAQLGL